MKSYMHTDSSVVPPTMRAEALSIYRAIAAGAPVTMTRGHYLPEDLDLVAERLRCDEAAAGLLAHGVQAHVVDREPYVSVAVWIWEPDGCSYAVDSEALKRAEAKAYRAAAERVKFGANGMDRPGDLAKSFLTYAQSREDDARYAETVRGPCVQETLDRMIKEATGA